MSDLYHYIGNKCQIYITISAISVRSISRLLHALYKSGVVICNFDSLSFLDFLTDDSDEGMIVELPLSASAGLQPTMQGLPGSGHVHRLSAAAAGPMYTIYNHLLGIGKTVLSPSFAAVHHQRALSTSSSSSSPPRLVGVAMTSGLDVTQPTGNDVVYRSAGLYSSATAAAILKSHDLFTGHAERFHPYLSSLSLGQYQRR